MDFKPNHRINQQTQEAYSNPRRKYRRRGTGDGERKEECSEDEDMSFSSDHEHELDDFSELKDDDSDIETGLHAEERRKFLHQKRREKDIGSRIAGSTMRTSDTFKNKKEKNILRELLINACLICLWYIFSLSISLYNKWMFSADNLNFHFPLFTTSLHMVVQFLLASTILLLIPSLRPSTTKAVVDPHSPHSADLDDSDYKSDSASEKPLVTPLFYVTRLLPCGITTSLDIGLGNTSLRYITLTFYTMCKSSVLLFVLLFAFIFRLESPTWRLTLIILSMTLGVLMMVAGETAFVLSGFLLAISASFFSGFRWALTQILLLRNPATRNPFAAMFFLAPIMFASLFLIAVFAEGLGEVSAGLRILVSQLGIAKTIGLMIVPGGLAFCMIASEFTLLMRTNVVTLSICGIFKEVVTIGAAGAVFGDTLSVVNVFGLVVTIGSIAAYNWMKIEAMRREVRQEGIKERVKGYMEAARPLIGDGQEK